MILKMFGDELIKRLMAGERDFSHIELEPEFDFTKHDSYGELKKYLHSRNLKDEPLILIQGSLVGANLSGLVLPYTKAYNADMRRVKVMHGTWYHSIFHGTDLSHGKWLNTDLRCIDVYDALISHTHFEKSDLRDILNLRLGKHIETANFRQARLNQSDILAIDAAKKNKTLEQYAISQKR